MNETTGHRFHGESSGCCGSFGLTTSLSSTCTPSFTVANKSMGPLHNGHSERRFHKLVAQSRQIPPWPQGRSTASADTSSRKQIQQPAPSSKSLVSARVEEVDPLSSVAAAASAAEREGDLEGVPRPSSRSSPSVPALSSSKRR